MKLYIDGKEVTIGQDVTSFRGETATVLGWMEPNHLGSTGRIHVRFHATNLTGEYFPSVFGAEWRETEGGEQNGRRG